MALKIDQGLFKTDFTDHHAILGVPVDASPKDIRKRYLKIARRLHPDSSAITTEADRQLANELLSKLVNPAYEKLTQEKEQAEYALVLKLKGKQARQQQDTILLTSEAAGRLAGATNYAHIYTTALSELSGKQYDNLSDTAAIIGQISELNLVYLMKQAQTGQPSQPPGPSSLIEDEQPGNPPPPPPQPPVREEKASREQILRRYLDRAKLHESQGNFQQAIRELRDAIKLDPKSAECHSRLGSVYLRSKQLTMAKVHFNQALKLDPQDTLAKAALRRLDPNAAKKTATGKKTSAQGKGKSRGGLFGLFGEKKK